MRDGGAYGCAVPMAYANLNPGLEPAEDEEERCRRLRVDRRRSSRKVRLVGDGDVHFATGVVVVENSLLGPYA